MFRLSKQLLKREFTRAGPMQHLLLRYTQALLTQMAQTAVRNRHHSVDQIHSDPQLLAGVVAHIAVDRVSYDHVTCNLHSRR